ncbi:MAG: precorrin-6Y C5,15-methyltransferase (decarboxylating) subunit CbiT [Propionicimonas sp.]
MTFEGSGRPPRTGLQLSAGLPDQVFVTDGLLTKRVLRAYALAMLAPVAGERLWDLGAGTGSIGIEWCRLHPDNSAIAVERDPERVERIVLNAVNLGVADRLEVVTGSIAPALDLLDVTPDAVFVGGGVEATTLRRCWESLPAGGRLVVHSVTAESDAVLLAAHAEWGGELNRVSVEVAEPIGRLTGFRPFRTVTAWAAVKA